MKDLFSDHSQLYQSARPSYPQKVLEEIHNHTGGCIMWSEQETKYGFNLVQNENGPTLGYCPESGVKIIESKVNLDPFNFME